MRFQFNIICWLIIIIVSACTVLSHVIPQTPHNDNELDSITVGCNVSKSCFLVPDSCLTTGSCRAGVAVAAIGGRFQFEMMAVDSVYVAVGLSDDAWMGKDSVVECVHDAAAKEAVQIFVSFNDDTTNTRIKTSAAENGVNLVDGSFVNGVVRCTFTRDNTTRAEGVVFDLAKRQYHLLVASGSKLKEDGIGIAFHDRESSGSRNGRMLADVGMFVDPTSVSVGDKQDSVEESEVVEVGTFEDHDSTPANDLTTPDVASSEELDHVNGTMEVPDRDLGPEEGVTEDYEVWDYWDDAVESDEVDVGNPTEPTPSVDLSDEHDDVNGTTEVPELKLDQEEGVKEDYEAWEDWDDDVESEEVDADNPTTLTPSVMDNNEGESSAYDVDDTEDGDRGIWDDDDSDEVDGEDLVDFWSNYEPGKTFTARGCNETKSCFLMPPSCLHTDACTLAASVKRTDAGFEFEMLALDSAYVAVALSTDAIMGSDSVVECLTDGADLVAYTSWNKGHKNHRIHEPLSKSGVALIEGSTEGGKVYCKFARDSITTAEEFVFDLNRSKFHLLMASGSKLKAEGIGFHNRGYAGSYNGRLLGDVGMFAQRRHRHGGMIDESEEEDDDDAGSYELPDAFQPIVTIV